METFVADMKSPTIGVFREGIPASPWTPPPFITLRLFLIVNQLGRQYLPPVGRSLRASWCWWTCNWSVVVVWRCGECPPGCGGGATTPAQKWWTRCRGKRVQSAGRPTHAWLSPASVLGCWQGRCTSWAAPPVRATWIHRKPPAEAQEPKC